MMARMEIFIALTHLAFAGICYDCAAKSYGPTARFICEEDTFQWMLCFAAFAGPAHSTVCGVNDCSFGADGPTFALVDKLHVKQVGIDAGFLSLPRATTVGRFIDVTTATDRPTRSEERRVGKECRSRWSTDH